MLIGYVSYAERKEGKPFGEWSTGTSFFVSLKVNMSLKSVYFLDAEPTLVGPHYDEDNLSNALSTHKVSMVRTNP